MKKMMIAILAIATLFMFVNSAQAEKRVFKFQKETPSGIDFGSGIQTPNTCIIGQIEKEQMLAGSTDLYMVEYDETRTGGCKVGDENFKKYGTLLRYDANGSAVLYVVNMETQNGGIFVEQKIMDANAVQQQIIVVQQQTSSVGQQVATVGNQVAIGQSRELAVAACKGRVNQKYRKPLNSGTTWEVIGAGINKLCKGECNTSKDIVGIKANMQDRKWMMAIEDCESNPGPNTSPVANSYSDTAYTNSTYSTPYYPPYDYGYNSQPQRAPGSLSNCLSQCMQQINDGPRCYQYCR